VSAALPVHFDPASQDFTEDPYEIYRHLRRSAPVLPFEYEGNAYWILSRYEDIARAVVTWRDYTVAKGVLIQDSPQRAGYSLATIDPPRHEELRRVYARAFTAERIHATEGDARRHARSLIDNFRDRRSFDLVEDFAKPLFNRAIGSVIGIHQQDQDSVLTLLADVYSESSPFGAPIKFAALPALNKFMLDQVKSRETGDRNDLMSVLYQAHTESTFASEQEIATASVGVLLAGFSTTIHQLGNLIAALESHPDQRHTLVKDLSFAPAAVEEGARYDTAGHAFARSATCDLNVAGVTIPAGGRVVLLYASANRDEDAIPEADRYDLGRKAVRHFGFGSAPHFCLGAPLARFLLKVAIEELLPVLGDRYKLDRDTAIRPVNLSARGYDYLHVTF